MCHRRQTVKSPKDHPTIRLNSAHTPMPQATFLVPRIRACNFPTCLKHPHMIKPAKESCSFHVPRMETAASRMRTINEATPSTCMPHPICYSAKHNTHIKSSSAVAPHACRGFANKPALFMQISSFTIHALYTNKQTNNLRCGCTKAARSKTSSCLIM